VNAPSGWRGHLDKLALLSLLVMTMLWGSTFVILKDLLTRIGTSDLLAVRFAIAALVLVAVAGKRVRPTRRLLIDGTIAGLFYSSGQLLQTYGLARTSVSISGFLTGLYVVMTPIIEAMLLRARVSRRVWSAVALATLGLGILTVSPATGTTRFGLGELLTVLSALAYAGHIVWTGRVSTPETSLGLSTVQTVVIAIMCAAAAAPGGIVMPDRAGDWIAIVYLATCCGALAVFLQVWAQSRVDATRAAIVMSFEPIWAAAFAIALGMETFGWRTAAGGAALVAAMIVSSIPRRTPAGAIPPTGELHAVRDARDACRGRPPTSSGSVS